MEVQQVPQAPPVDSGWQRAPQVVRCPRVECGRQPIPTGWPHQLCGPCLSQIRDARAQVSPPQTASHRHHRPCGTRIATPAPIHETAPQKRKPSVVERRTIVACKFCTAHVIVPPGSDASTPLLCEKCFKGMTAANNNHPPSVPWMVLNLNGPPQSSSPSAHYKPPYQLNPIVATTRSLPTSRAAPHVGIKHPEAPAVPERTHRADDFGAGTVPVACQPQLSPREDVVPPDESPAPETSLEANDEMDVDFDDLDLAYPEEDPDVVLQDSSSPPDSPEKSSGPSVFDLPEGWESDISELTELTDSGESEIEDDDEDTEPAKTGLKIRIKVPPGFRFRAPTEGSSTSTPHGGAATADGLRTCSTKSCKRVVDSASRWKRCQPCREKRQAYRKAAKQSLNGATLERQEQQQACPTAQGDEHGNPVRICAIRSCKFTLPSVAQYRYKMCERCRTHTRLEARRRKLLRLPRVQDAHPKDGKAKVGLSRRIIAQYRAMQAREQKEKAAETAGDVTSGSNDQQLAEVKKLTSPPPPMVQDAHPSGADLSSPPCKPDFKNDAFVPMFQDKTHLLRDLRVLVADFLRGLIQYTRSKTSLPKSIFFQFGGQYSTATDAELDSEYTGEEMLSVKKGIEDVLGLHFSPMLFPFFDNEYIVSRFRCVHSLTLPIADGPNAARPGPLTSESAHDAMQANSRPTTTRKMIGDIEVRVALDREHPVLAGHRVVVGFRLCSERLDITSLS
ncbi:hypothetical protein FA95DRAFT_1553066 [Auriscalpium vulgare]|uniref:Uncharacterized protein n=1 Tax=Auriscalpium vulgare TaxID=40419 RepID=A0ACB8SA57_9AGAM|nr:hypothetical protein FA95DRAFT_1553066 [Auriscalpium vulgare]